MQIQKFLQINVRVSGVLKHPLVWETNPQLLKIAQMCRILKCTMSQSKDQDIFIFII